MEDGVPKSLTLIIFLSQLRGSCINNWSHK